MNRGVVLLQSITITNKVTSYEQLQELFRQAQVQNQPVALYRKPRPGELKVDFSTWNSIDVFDIDNLMVIVPPGILLKDLNAIAAEQGLRFIPGDTPYFGSLSVGEWAYRGCPNPSSWKYGAGKHFLLGATYVFPNGDLATVGGKCIKNVTGYDFTRFLTGPYADLAVGVQYIIKLMPQSAFRYRYDIAFPALDNATQFVSELQSRSVAPAWLFWADETAAAKLFGLQREGQRVLLELDGNETEVLAFKAAVDALSASCQGKVAAEVVTVPELSFRETAADGFWLLDEFKIPYQAVPAFSSLFASELTKRGAQGGLCGQLAEGKIHVYVQQNLADRDDFFAALQTEAKALGGTSSGKYARLYQGGSTDPLATIEKSFKEKLDPGLIFNRREVAVNE